MSRERLCRVCGGFHDTEKPWPWECRGHFPEPPHATMQIIRDCMDDTMNPANGQRYTSKRAYYKAVRAAGCEIVGNEQQKQVAPQIDDPTKDILEAVQKVKQGYKPPPRRANG